MKKTPIASFVALALAVGTFAASATIPDSNGEIHGCFRKSDGRLRVINTEKGRVCRPKEKPLSWNEEGRRGPRGRQGLQGESGEQGEQGLQGMQGPPGAGSPISEHLVGSCTSPVESASDACSVISWTQPPNTLGRLYYRVNITAPGGTCQSVEAAILGGWEWWLNDEPTTGYGSVLTLGPGETAHVPHVGSHEFVNLFPGEYELKTGGFATVDIAPDCTDTFVETELFVVTEASVA